MATTTPIVADPHPGNGLDETLTLVDEGTFTPFAFLPLELRNMIWKEASSQARIVVIYARPIASSKVWNDDDTFTDYSHQYKSYNPVPSVLHTTKESREEGLKHYSLDFSTQKYQDIGNLLCAPTTAPRVYFNWNVDSICLRGCTSSYIRYADLLSISLYDNLLTRCISNSIKSISLDMRWIGESQVIRFCLGIPSLEDVVIFHSSDDENRVLLGKGELEFQSLEENANLPKYHYHDDEVLAHAIRARDRWYNVLNKVPSTTTNQATTPTTTPIGPILPKTRSSTVIRVQLMRVLEDGQDRSVRYTAERADYGRCGRSRRFRG